MNWEVLDALNQDPRFLGQLVLIPFLEGRRSPNGLDAQQRAEIKAEEVFGRASSAVGFFVGLSQQIEEDNMVCENRKRKKNEKVSITSVRLQNALIH